MRRLRMCVPMMLLVLLLSACGGAGEAKGSPAEELALVIRGEFLDMTALTAPAELAGITARIRDKETALEYDGVRWETGALNDSGMSPVDAIPALLRYAQKGFMAECGMETVEETELLRIVCRDPEGTAGVGQECSLWFDSETHALVRGELSQDGFTVIQCRFTEFARS